MMIGELRELTFEYGTAQSKGLRSVQSTDSFFAMRQGDSSSDGDDLEGFRRF
jgi:hypothetical protein